MKACSSSNDDAYAVDQRIILTIRDCGIIQIALPGVLVFTLGVTNVLTDNKVRKGKRLNATQDFDLKRRKNSQDR